MKKIIVITGPTAVGKTKLSIAVAKAFNGEIINADSTQVFKHLDIATAKVTEVEKEGIVHHLIDSKEINEDYTVYDYQKEGRIIIDEILKRKKTPIIVGGTGLYIKALLYDYEFKEEIKLDYSSYSDLELYQQLLKVDPNTDIHQNNRKRMERALNYYDIHHEPMSDKKQTDTLLYDTLFIGLTTDRERLYDKINSRVDDMIQHGLLEEAKKIYDTKIKSKAVMTPIGYKELFDYFDHKYTLEEAVELIKQRSRHYAKRQYTWFNHQMDITWFQTDYDNFHHTIDDVMDYINKNK